MSELDSVTIYNPTSEDFSHAYNGERRTMAAQNSISLAEPVAFHLAHHLAKRMLADEWQKRLNKVKDKEEKKKLMALGDAYQIHDNPLKRIYLYQILGNKELVERVIRAYPYKGFLGEMKEYDDFVASLPDAEPAVATS